MSYRGIRVLFQLLSIAAPSGCGGEGEPGDSNTPPESSQFVAAETETGGETAKGNEDPARKSEVTVDASSAAVERAEIPRDMLGVPGGTFTMGADKVGEADEQPAHDVTLKPFLLDRTEVTNRAYKKCVAAEVCRQRKQPCVKGDRLAPEKMFLGGSHPVSCVSHDDAETYCRWLGRRLPTEAEWERAARGSDARRFPWGDETPDEKRGVFRGRVTQPVGSCPAGAGPYGHLDMAGNVWEWLADRYDPFAYRRETVVQGVPAGCDEILRTQDALRRKGLEGFTGSNPIPTECEYCLRGGAFNYGGGGLRSSNRVHHPGDWRIIMAGFRCAADWAEGPVD
ncbi:MAG: formylglycine-generating enzyme family protein [Deltaproteobacteria bacterium]|nr:formylglycine-generating enzyme family protein [Deltaproteobacteria bacterium]